MPFPSRPLKITSQNSYWSQLALQNTMIAMFVTQQTDRQLRKKFFLLNLNLVDVESLDAVMEGEIFAASVAPTSQEAVELRLVL
jgi:hypothetical protein